MPIIEITDSHAVQRCACCGHRRELAVGDLLPTDERGTVLTLPACPCGAVEFLIGTPEDEPEYPAPGSFGHQHRLVVNALVDAVRHGGDDGEANSLRTVVAERIGQKAIGDWFPDGLRLEPSESISDVPERTANKDQR